MGKISQIPWNKGKKGLQKGWSKGMKCPQISQAKKDKNFKHSEQTKKKISLSKKGWVPPAHWIEKQKLRVGENNGSWIRDRSKLKKQDRRNDPAYKEWRKQVWLRDDFKCKIANPDCKGRIEAHHIKRWADYIELRYYINNGVTLCHFHHPRGKKKEDELSLIFLSKMEII